MRYILSFLVIFAIGVVSQAKMVSAQGGWTVTLTKKQNKGLAEYQASPNPKAFAISPDGPWGFWYGADTTEESAKRALGACRQHLRRGKRDCILYARNDKVVTGQQVQTRKVTKVYKPVDGKLAPQVFGLINASFQGDRASAMQEYARLQQQNYSAKALKSDPALSKLLTAGSVVADAKRAWMFMFYKRGGEQRSVGKNAILQTYFDSWVSTKSGLVCTFGEHWDTGKGIGTRCIVIDQIANGKIKYIWADQGRPVRKANLIAGDARWGAVR
ncbi:MAG: hypothetical protein N4A61_07580 [Pelagimonas sp.]|nr:hypothetical protein [Pelagimonas sp.]